MANYYDRLNIKKDASEEEIKRAYRQEAMRLHPDKGGSHTAMRKLNKMYHTLTDPKKRKRYNQTLDGKRVKVVEIRKPTYQPEPERHTYRPTENIWEDHIHTSQKREKTKPRPDNLKEEDLKILWGRQGPPKNQLAKHVKDYVRGGVNTKVLKEAQELLAQIKKKKPLLGSKIDTAYIQLGQIINLLGRKK